MRKQPDSDFFIGYAPMPPSLTRFSIGIALFVFVLGLGIGAVAASFQRSPGPGLGTTDWNVTLTGTLVAKPYPHLLVRDEHATKAVLLVRGGKNGSPSVRPTLDGTSHTARGALFTRNGQSLLELYSLKPNDEATATAAVSAEPIKKGEATLSGEIVDSKCYFGRMKPGYGQTHRACAQYCVGSGIPPVLVTRNADAARAHYLLTTVDRTPANDLVFDYVAEAVTVTGTVFTTDLGTELRIASGAIARR